MTPSRMHPRTIGAAMALLLALPASGCADDEPADDRTCPRPRTDAASYDRACVLDEECEVVAYQSCPCDACGAFALRGEEVDRFRLENPRCGCEKQAACGACQELVAGCEAGECRMYECVSADCAERTLLPDDL